MITKLIKDSDGSMSILIAEYHYSDGEITEITSCEDKGDQKPAEDTHEK